MISYVLSDCHLSGGARVVFEHVRGLTERGHAAQVLYKTGSPTWFTPAVPAQQIDPSQLVNVRGIKVATWCDTANWVAASLREGDKGFYLVQDIDEETYYRREPVTYSLGLRHIVEGRWVERQLRDRFKVDPTWVGIGTRYGPPLAIIRERHRVFAQCVPKGAHQSGDLKGWGLTAETMKLIHASDPSTSLVTFGRGRARTVSPRIPQIHVKSPTDKKLRELYSQAGVFLYTSRHEGFGLCALEAMACGCPVVCTDADGNAEFCHVPFAEGETALIGSTPEELAEACVAVMNDQYQSATLIANGLAMAENYRWPSVIDKIEAIYTNNFPMGD